MNWKLIRYNARCALAYWIKLGRRCNHGVEPEVHDALEAVLGRPMPDATTMSPWWPTNPGADEVRSCDECGRMEKRPADHDELSPAEPEGVNS